MGQWWANCGPWANSDLLPGFENMVLLEYGYNHSFQLSMDAFLLQRQCWIVVTETVRPTKPKIFTVLPL